MGIQLGRGDADLRALRGGLAFGAANVGTPPQKIGGNAHRDARGANGMVRRAEHLFHVPRRHPQKNAKLVGRLPAQRLQRRDDRLGLRQVRLALGHVEPRRRPVLKLEIGQAQALALVVDVLPGVLQPLFGRAEIRVLLGNFGQQQNQHVVVVLNRGVQSCVGRLDGSAKPAPEIEFPGKAGSHGPFVVIQHWRRGGRILAYVRPHVVAKGLLRLREQLSNSDAPLGAGFENRRPAMRNERFCR